MSFICIESHASFVPFFVLVTDPKPSFLSLYSSLSLFPFLSFIYFFHSSLISLIIHASPHSSFHLVKRQSRACLLLSPRANPHSPVILPPLHSPAHNQPHHPSASTPLFKPLLSDPLLYNSRSTPARFHRPVARPPPSRKPPRANCHGLHQPSPSTTIKSHSPDSSSRFHPRSPPSSSVPPPSACTAARHQLPIYIASIPSAIIPAPLHATHLSSHAPSAHPISADPSSPDLHLPPPVRHHHHQTHAAAPTSLVPFAPDTARPHRASSPHASTAYSSIFHCQSPSIHAITLLPSTRPPPSQTPLPLALNTPSPRREPSLKHLAPSQNACTPPSSASIPTETTSDHLTRCHRLQSRL